MSDGRTKPSKARVAVIARWATKTIVTRAAILKPTFAIPTPTIADQAAVPVCYIASAAVSQINARRAKPTKPILASRFQDGPALANILTAPEIATPSLGRGWGCRQDGKDKRGDVMWFHGGLSGVTVSLSTDGPERDVKRPAGVTM